MNGSLLARVVVSVRTRMRNISPGRLAAESYGIIAWICEWLLLIGNAFLNSSSDLKGKRVQHERVISIYKNTFRVFMDS